MIVTVKGQRGIWTKRNQADFNSDISVPVIVTKISESVFVSLGGRVTIFRRASSPAALITLKENLLTHIGEDLYLQLGFIRVKGGVKGDLNALAKLIRGSGVKTREELNAFYTEHCEVMEY